MTELLYTYLFFYTYISSQMYSECCQNTWNPVSKTNKVSERIRTGQPYRLKHPDPTQQQVLHGGAPFPLGTAMKEGSPRQAASVSWDRQTAALSAAGAAAPPSIKEKGKKVLRKRKRNLAGQGGRNVHSNEDPKVGVRLLCMRKLEGGDSKGMVRRKHLELLHQTPSSVPF